MIGDLKTQLEYAYKLEEEFWRAKNRVLWLQAGDKNTKFFHAKTRQRRMYNRITSLTDDDVQLLFRQEDINNHVIAYFTNVFTTSSLAVEADFLQQIRPRVTSQMNESLLKPVTEGEVIWRCSKWTLIKRLDQMGLQWAFIRIIGSPLKTHWLVLLGTLWKLLNWIQF